LLDLKKKTETKLIYDLNATVSRNDCAGFLEIAVSKLN
jgi:hypothetical protein